MNSTLSQPSSGLYGFLVLALTVAFPTVHAQSSDSGATSQPLEEVVVSARKRAEFAQQVPTAVSPLNGERIEREALYTSEQLLQRVPGVNIARVGAPFADQLSIRGQGSGRATNAESSTGLYRNGAFVAGGNLGGGNLSRLDLFDVERVEVYRGPQGATFGRNAIGGAINVVSRQPGDEPGGYVDIGVGEKDRLELRAAIDLPVSQILAARIGLLHIDQNDGFFENTLTGDAEDKERATGARIALRFAPVDRFLGNLTLDYLDEETPSIAVGSFNPLDPASDPFSKPYTSPNRFDREEFTGIFEFEIEFDVATLAGVSLYKSRDAKTKDDTDSFANLEIPFLQDLERQVTEDFRRYGQELRLVSNSSGPLSWVIGAEVQRLENDTLLVQSGAPVPVAIQNLQSDSRSRDWSYASYGLVGYQLTPTLEITGEIRQTRDDKKFDLQLTRFTPTGDPIQTKETPRESFNNTSPVVTLAWSPNNAVNAYLRYATGYRAGGFNNVSDDVNPPRFGIVYQPEEAASFEAGLKLSLLRDSIRFNVAAFRTETDDLLLNQFEASETGGLLNFVTNAGETELSGIEAELSFFAAVVPLGGRISVDLSAAWNEGEIEEGPNEGEDIPFLRDRQFSISTSYTQPLIKGLELFAVHNYRAAWGGFEDPENLRPQDDFKLNDIRFGLRGDRWSVAGEYQNLSDADFTILRIAPDIEKINVPRQWLIRLNYSF